MTGRQPPEAAALRRWLVGRVAALAGVDERLVDVAAPLSELGLSSLQTTTLTAQLSERVGRAVPENLAWERPTIASLVERLTQGEPAAVTPGADGTAAAVPIAVVGVGCRFPGAEGPAAFWRLLDEGRDAVGEVPPERWAGYAHGDPAAERVLAGVPRRAGVLGDVAGFDAEFFGITPREAALMDPQQRILLEVVTAALEHAGLPPQSLRGSQTGVFVGASAAEYAQLTTRELTAIQEWTATGAAPSVLANRLSYVLDLRGPSMAVDTACSSSLVAVHLACRSLADRESDCAVAAGVNLLLTPAVSANFELAGALSSDGHCKAFDASADGIVRGEGCGVVVLKRLSDARRDGSRVLAVIRGSVTNSDGRSNGLMAPNPSAQRDLLARACARADVDGTAVDYVEAHGTGTPLGDPIEADALGTVLGRGREPERPLLLGSVKTNLGHLEAAAGVAGLLKVVLSMVHGRIPPSLHFREANPRLHLERDRLRVVTGATPWPRYSGRAVAGVSGFGFGGTNAHVVLEEWPQHRPADPPQDAGGPAPVHVLALSDADPVRVRAYAARLADALAAPDAPDPADVAHTLALRRDRLPCRAAVVGAGRAELAAGLRELAAGGRSTVRSTAAAQGVVWVFPGFGSQYPGMAQRLLDADPVFADAVRELDAAFAEEAGMTLTDALRGVDETTDILRDQLALFGVQVALASRWRAAGVEPAAVIGHSMGEAAAAVAAGALDVRDGLRVMAVRARLLAGANTAGGGAMAVVELSPAELAELVAESGERLAGVTVAVYAAPQQLTVTGPGVQVAELVRRTERAGRMAKALRVSAAGHSRSVDPLLEELRAELTTLVPSVPKVAWYSTVSEDPREVPAFDAAYWAANLRRPVRFTAAVGAAAHDGHQAFLELSPNPVLAGPLEATLRAEGVRDPLVAGTLRRRQEDVTAFHTQLAELHLHGHPALLAERYRSGRLVDLPQRVWQHRRYWFGEAPDAAAGDTAASGPVPRGTGGVPGAPGGSGAPDGWGGPEVLRGMEPGRARAAVAARLRSRLAEITGHPPQSLTGDRPLTALGLDSLMAQRTRNAMEQDFGVRLPLTPLLRGAGLDDVEGFLARELRLDAAAPPAAGEQAAGPGPAQGSPAPHAPAPPPGHVGPRDPAERLVARVWRQVLDTGQVSVADDFFALGGDAARAARLTGLLAAELGRPLDAGALLARPTVQAMADVIRPYVETAGASAGGVLHVLRAAPHPGEGPHPKPLFLFHPAGGPASVYRPLVGRLSTAVACYGLERLAGTPAVEEKAAHYARVLRERQPEGPYRLGGWSFGGLLAFETARQLTADGHRVDLVAMIDCILPLTEDASGRRHDPTARHQRFVEHIERTYGTPLDVPWPRLAERDAGDQMRLLVELLRQAGLGIGEAALHHQYTSAVDTQAAERYRPESYDGPVVLYRAAEPHALTVSLDPRYLRTDHALGWAEFCTDLTVVDVPGDHVSVIDPPHIDVIAAHLDAALTSEGGR
ncbi:beta-ketoacyl synthase N-terminal-like domain-containing protein [Streptomyces sp. TRM 70351]|uniref:beta-ketoacyl synthase N-terminal-like domain-containing protein n=1 Tax=Streptomyces sp. TRM 70351 TaxID=3116552 RepID=UPI002E7AE62F|nr:beta-ketoacyl synthase N-terminal-like domain-containing protein [Streptomyces sp. TRM 70351]MEE1930235.1 beta-ketoacyl synthase N-terminal-like domain-containing protein [Streptomyces sp. TRM 70351]